MHKNIKMSWGWAGSLPIVKKIIEEHGGTLSLEDAAPFEGQPNFGARAVITLPVAIKQVEQEQAV